MSLHPLFFKSPLIWRPDCGLRCRWSVSLKTIQARIAELQKKAKALETKVKPGVDKVVALIKKRKLTLADLKDAFSGKAGRPAKGAKKTKRVCTQSCKPPPSDSFRRLGPGFALLQTASVKAIERPTHETRFLGENSQNARSSVPTKYQQSARVGQHTGEHRRTVSC